MGRAFKQVKLTFKARLYHECIPAYRHGERLAFSEDDESVIEDVHVCRRLVPDKLIFDVRGATLCQCLKRLEHLERDIIAKMVS